jgi:hypothetical protein
MYNAAGQTSSVTQGATTTTIKYSGLGQSERLSIGSTAFGTGFADPRQVNPYVYAGDDPIDLTDPSGLILRKTVHRFTKACAVGTVFGASSGAATGATAGLIGGPAAPATVSGGAAVGGISGAVGGCVTGVLSKLF